MSEFHGFKKTYPVPVTESGSKQLDFYVRPSNWLRYIFKSWYYWTGDEVRFRIGVRDKNDSSYLGTLAIYEDLPRPSHWKEMEERYKLLTNPYEAAFARGNYSHKYIELKGSRINAPGIGYYTVGYPGSDEAKVIITFEAKPRETKITAFFCIIAPLVSGVIGGIIGYFLARGVN